MEANIARSKAAYETLCQTMDEMKLNYGKDEENLRAYLRATGDDLPVEMVLRIYPERCRLVLLSKLPLTVPEDKKLDMAIAVSAINNRLAFGSFDYTLDRDHVVYRMTNCFIDCTPGMELFKWVIICGFRTVDEYNDKLVALMDGTQSVEQFISSMNA